MKIEALIIAVVSGFLGFGIGSVKGEDWEQEEVQTILREISPSCRNEFIREAEFWHSI